jgi:PAS domain S-box-containing protein
VNILVVSQDEDAAFSLCSALERSGQQAVWEQAVAPARALIRLGTPLVLVADTAVPEHSELLDEVRDRSPWTRIYLMADPSVRFPHALVPVVAKPFDAAELAELLGRERELAELDRGRRTLQAHAEDLALLVEASFEAIVGLDSDGVIRSWNQGAANVYGYAAEAALGRHISLLEVDPEAASLRLSAHARQVVEVRRKRNDGREISVLLALSLVPASRSYALVEVSLDITERRKLERELEHSERLASIGRLAASMAHEINNPLAVVHASSTYVAEVAGRTGDGELAECARDMHLAVERIGSFVQHVCGFARRERPQLTDTPLMTAVDIAVRLARPRAKDRSVELLIENVVTTRVPHDPPRVAQAILNLLSNAIDAASSRGRHVWLRVIEERERVCVQVDDDGPGVASEIASRVFEPFATTKPHGQGTGLGLAITRQILQDHGGSVGLLAREEGGTRAEIVLPSLNAASYRVLVIDADPAVRRALASELRREGFDVFLSGGLLTGRDILNGKSLNVLVSDVFDDDSEEAAVLEELMAGSVRPRWLVVTADAASGRVDGADLILAKPWDRAELIDSVRRLCVA